MGLSWQQGPLAPGAVGRFLVPGPLPDRMLFAEPLRRRMRVRFGGDWIADSEDVVLLHEPGRYPVAYFPLAAVADGSLQPGGHTTQHADLGPTTWYTVQRRPQQAARRLAARRVPDYASELKGRVAFAWRAMEGFYEEDERIVGHAADPYHRIDIRQTSRHLTVRYRPGHSRHQAGAGAVRVRVRPPLVRPPQQRRPDRAHPGRWPDLLPYKGLASYYDIGGARRAAWSYEDAWTGVRRISGLISFEPDQVEVRARRRPGSGSSPARA